MLKDYLQKLINKQDLTQAEMETVFEYIIDGQSTVQLSALLALLSAKGETVVEVAALVGMMRKIMQHVHTLQPTLDIVGTGGDGFNTVNISTASALLAASCGVHVAKHGNRSVSSLCGSADILDYLGFNIDMSAAGITQKIDEYNFGFIYAPNFHPALATIKSLRKQLGIPAIFNMVGPLLNPANAQYLMIGVADKQQLGLMAEVVKLLGVEHAFVFHCCGMDEVTTVGPVDIIEVKQNTLAQFVLDPRDYGFKLCSVKDLQGGSVEKNALLIKTALGGEASALADTLILNAGLANYIYGISESIEDGISLARESQSQSKAQKLLKMLTEKQYA